MARAARRRRRQPARAASRRGPRDPRAGRRDPRARGRHPPRLIPGPPGPATSRTPPEESRMTAPVRDATAPTTSPSAPTLREAFHQPRSVWAIAFAATVSFMGIGLVDPILPAISSQLDATPSQAMLLFTSYLFITAIAMFFTSWFASRFGVRRTLLAGLVLVVVFAALCSLSSSVTGIIGLRAGRSEEHTSELQSRGHLVCRLLLE